MNCSDSVLNSDELPVRGIDQCPSTLSTQRSPGLVLVKWNRLLALFRTAWLYLCFVEAEAFLKCVNLCVSKESYFLPLLHSGSWHCVSALQCCSFCEHFAICRLRTLRLDSKVETLSLNWHLNLQKITTTIKKTSIGTHQIAFLCVSRETMALSQSISWFHKHVRCVWCGDYSPTSDL